MKDKLITWIQASEVNPAGYNEKNKEMEGVFCYRKMQQLLLVFSVIIVSCISVRIVALNYWMVGDDLIPKF